MADVVDAGWTRHGWWIGTGDKVSPTEQPPTVLLPCNEGPLGGCAGCTADADRILGGRAVECTRVASHRLGAPRCVGCGGKGWHETPEDARADLAQAIAPAAPSAPGATNPATPVGQDVKIGRDDLRAKLLQLVYRCNHSGAELIETLLNDGWAPPGFTLERFDLDEPVEFYDHTYGQWRVGTVARDYGDQRVDVREYGLAKHCRREDVRRPTSATAANWYVDHDPRAAATYCGLRARVNVWKTHETGHGVNVDFAPDGRVIGFKILDHRPDGPAVEPVAAVLKLQQADQLGYVRPSDEWVNGQGEPLPDDQQQAAHSLVRVGLLPGFEEATRGA
ncbi:hypothetical protein GCM10027258_62960 [Amycolatopsis stemonae]